MSDHSEPYANGFGILAGIIILWVGTFALCVIFKSLFYGDPAAESQDEEQESRVGAQGVDVAFICRFIELIVEVAGGRGHSEAPILMRE